MDRHPDLREKTEGPEGVEGETYGVLVVPEKRLLSEFQARVIPATPTGP